MTTLTASMKLRTASARARSSAISYSLVFAVSQCTYTETGHSRHRCYWQSHAVMLLQLPWHTVKFLELMNLARVKLLNWAIWQCDLCVDVVSRSCQPLRYIRRWISRKPLEIEAWIQKTTNRKWHMAYQIVTWPMTSIDPERSNSWPQYALECNVSKTAGDAILATIDIYYLVRCEAVRSAILATAWLVVMSFHSFHFYNY